MIQAVSVAVLDPLFNALSTPEGWIGLLLGLGGRETIGYVRSAVKQLRGGANA